MVPAYSLKVPRASSYSGSRLLPLPFAYTTLTSSGRSFQYRSARLGLALCGPKPHGARTMVWALPRSLAATYGIIIIFSSSGYLDVSVHRVPSVYLWIQYTVTGSASRVSPFRYLRIPACLRLPVAFRSLSRLSSALSAKASTLRPFLLNLRSAASEFIFFRSLVLKMSPSHGDSCSVDFTSSARKLVFDAFASYCLLLSQYLVSDLSDNYLSVDNPTSLS